MEPIEQSLAIFLVGATGDLSKKKILPALYQLFTKQLLPAHFYIIGTARKDFTSERFHEFAKNCVQPSHDGEWLEFCNHLYYVSADVTDVESFMEVRKLYMNLDQCSNHLWYVSTLPSLYVSVARNIKKAGLHTTTYGWTKFLIEKPFGTDLETARTLNTELLQVFPEDSIYRIDHFLGKETVQNLLAFRFANGVFEHLWNWKYVSYVTVTASETIGAEGRTAFYNQTGAIRDIFQNHILQMVAMSLMEEPASLNPGHIDIRRQEFLQSLRPFDPNNIAQSVVFGQYTAGAIHGEAVRGYLEETGMPSHSNTETAVACKLFSDTDRWQNVPIYVRFGKRLNRKLTEISIHFKEPFNQLFGKSLDQPRGNVLSLRIAPHEGILFKMHVKEPGLKLSVREVPMRFYYKHAFQMDLIEAYVKLIHDAIEGDTTLFPQAKGIEQSWQFVQPLLDYKNKPGFKPEPYVAGSWGPPGFDQLLHKNKMTWE
jgi:glucose-6-phosphate 1-dehydrogenase